MNGRKKDFGRIFLLYFLLYEEKLTRSGYSPMEVRSALISMRTELEEEPNENA